MPRHEYVLTLPHDASPNPTPQGATIAAATDADREALSQLLLDAYRDTIDYEGETIVEARSEIAELFDEGEPLLDASFLLHIDGALASAILAVPFEGAALIAFVMTRPEFTKRGCAAVLVERCVQALAEAHITQVHAFITEGNLPSEIVFSRAGFHVVPEETP